MNPKISVILPVYNVEKYIDQCLKSIADQSYDDIEVIVVDDCGSDRSMTIVKKFIDNYSGSKIFRIITHPQNKGLSAGRNTGIKNALGEFLFFIDSDDWLEKDNALELIYNAQCIHDATLTMANSRMIDDTTGKIYKVVDSDYVNDYSKNDNANQEYKIGGTAWNKLIKREFVIEHELYFDEGIVWEDTLWVFKLKCLAPTIETIDSITYNYRCRGGSIMNTFTEKHLYSFILLPLLASSYVIHHKIDKQQFAEKAIEDYMYGALKIIINATINGNLLKVIYKLYRKNLISLSVNTFIKAKMTTKMRMLHHIFPVSLGLLYERILIGLFDRDDRRANDSVQIGAGFINKIEKRISHE